MLQAIDGIAVGSRVEVVLPEDDSPFVHADRAQSERIVANLIENALRYSPPDEPVRVQVREIGSDVLVRVVDHGPGIPPSEAERIFEPFQRGCSPANPRRRARPRDSARLRRGERRAVWVESHEGQAPHSFSRCRSRERVECRHDGQRVLVVDDEQQILRALRTSLRGAGYEVETADTAERRSPPRRCGRPRP